MKRIYTVTHKATGEVARYVRAHSLNAAVRDHMNELFVARPTSAEDLFQAAKAGKLKVLDVGLPEQTDIEDKGDAE